MNLDREARDLRNRLPPRPLHNPDSGALQANPEYGILWVRGGYDRYDEKAPTQFAVIVEDQGVIAFKYYASKGEWRVIETGDWPEDAATIDDELNRVASSTAAWHTPLADKVED